MTDIESEDVSRREQLRALVRVARYRPVFTTAIIGAGVFAAALEAVGLSFILPIVEIVQSPGDRLTELVGLWTLAAIVSNLGISHPLQCPAFRSELSIPTIYVVKQSTDTIANVSN